MDESRKGRIRFAVFFASSSPPEVSGYTVAAQPQILGTKAGKQRRTFESGLFHKSLSEIVPRTPLPLFNATPQNRNAYMTT